MLQVSECPAGGQWDKDSGTCVNSITSCETEMNWFRQNEVDLDECIGLVGNKCQIGFIERERAKKYCENDAMCIGIKQMPCNRVTENMKCMGIYWRPFKKVISKVVDFDVYLVQRQGPEINEDENVDVVHKYNYATSRQMFYTSCADEFYDQTGLCSLTFDKLHSALSHCDQLRNCEGVAEQKGAYTAVSGVSDEINGFRANSKIGQVIAKLNKFIAKVLDFRTRNTMLVEPWTDDFPGQLVDCTHKEAGQCSPVFENKFEAQYYCESVGESCVGVSEADGEFKTMSDIVPNSTGSTKSSIKAPWCSPTLPPLSIEMPSILRKGSHVLVMWPVVNLKDLFVLMGKSTDEYLANTWSQLPMRQSEHDRYALTIDIKADTIIIDDHFTVFNIKNLSVTARKLIIKKKNILTFRQVDVTPDWFPDMMAPLPDIDNHGINGQHGASGFDATNISFELGCINGREDDLEIETFSGKGSNGQNGSSGKDGLNGRKEADSEKMIPRYNYCSLKDSCTKCCYGKGTGWKIPGKACTYGGSSGGDGGNGGTSGRPGSPGSIRLSFAKGLQQKLRSNIGGTGVPGKPGNIGKAGKDGEGGCGERVERCADEGKTHHTKCWSEQMCSGEYNGACELYHPKFTNRCIQYKQLPYKGADCTPNKDGEQGLEGELLKQNGEAELVIHSSASFIINADSMHQDFMLKYAVMLMNNQTVNEAQEILYFLTKFKSPTSLSATKLLSMMGKNGELKTDTKRVPVLSFDVLHERLNRQITRGKRLETLMNKLGELFDFTYMFYELMDTVLEIVEDELNQIEHEKHETADLVAHSYESLQHMELAIAMTHEDIYDDIDLLVSRINLQINSLERAADRQKRCASFSAVMSCVPLIGGGIKGAAAKSAEAWLWSEVSSKLSELECENLSVLDFLNEFVFKFAQLGEDITKLRTPEDFKNFETNALREFFSGDLRNMLKSEDFFVDFSCVLGLVEVNNDPPDFGLLPSLDSFFPMAQMTKTLDALIDAGKAIKECSKSDDKAKCYVKNCSKIIKAVNLVFDTGLDCKFLTFEQLEEWVKTVDEYAQMLLQLVNGIYTSLEELLQILKYVADLVSEIDYMHTIIKELMASDIFDGMVIETFYDLFSGM